MKNSFPLALTVLTMASLNGAYASNYPGNYCDQSVRIVTLGSALFANVNGCGSSIIFGYKKSGHLAASNPNAMDVVITGQCTLRDGSTVSKTNTIELGREWNGTGYMSLSQSAYGLLPYPCSYNSDERSPNVSYKVAFSNRANEWEPGNGGNYGFGSFVFGDDAALFETHESGNGGINLKAWQYIIDQMRK